MKLLLVLTLAMFPLFFSACATKEPEGLETSLRKQDEKMKSFAKKSRERADERERRWKNYSSNADASYNRWIDSVMQ